MQTIYIITIVLVLAIIGAAHFHYREKVGLAPNEVRICAAVNKTDCHHVDRHLAQAVYDKAQAIAEADDAETFPIETGDLDNTYSLSDSELTVICAQVVDALGINPQRVSGNTYFNQTKTVSELILFLHVQQQNQQT